MAIYVGNKRYAPYIGDKRRRYMGGSSSLPYDAEIEYIASTGTSGFCIDTGISRPSTFTSVQIECQMQFISTRGRQIQGASNATYFGVNANKWEAAYNQLVGTADTDMHILSKRLEVADNNSYFTFYVDNVQLFTQTIIYNANHFSTNVFLFTIDSSLNIGTYAKMKKADIYINDALVRDYIPVRVGQVGYLYDKISGELFGNTKTNAFDIGPDKT